MRNAIGYILLATAFTVPALAAEPPQPPAPPPPLTVTLTLQEVQQIEAMIAQRDPAIALLISKVDAAQQWAAATAAAATAAAAARTPRPQPSDAKAP